MNRRALTAAVSLSITLVVLASNVTAALAAQPWSLHIEVPELIGQSGEPFTATGSAVDEGVVCPSGTVDELGTVASGATSGPFTILHVLKRFNCSDASGSFDVRLLVRLNNATHKTTASWQVVSGTGAYAGLGGNGLLVGAPIVPGTSIYDVYDGKVH